VSYVCEIISKVWEQGAHIDDPADPNDTTVWHPVKPPPDKSKRSAGEPDLNTTAAIFVDTKPRIWAKVRQPFLPIRFHPN